MMRADKTGQAPQVREMRRPALGPDIGTRAMATDTRHRLRLLAWLLAVAAILIIPAVGPAAVAGAQDQDPASPGQLGPSFLPSDTAVYVEFRGDLPDEQAEALTAVIRRFPGFADTISIEAEIDAALEEAIRGATGGTVSWTDDVRSWFSGQVAGGLLGGWASLVDDADPSFLVGIEVTDPDAAMSFVRFASDLAGPALEGLIEESHAGTTIVSVADGNAAYALADGLLLVGTSPDAVRVGLDVLAGTTPSLASAPGFSAAMSRLPDARLATGYADLASLGPVIETVAQTDSSVDLGSMIDQLPLDLTIYAAARPDGAIVQAFVTPGPDTPTLATGAPHLAAAFPAGTQFLAEVPDVGSSLTTAASSMSDLIVEAVRRMAGRELEPSDIAALEVLGSSYERMIGWIDDVAVGAGFDRGQAWVGIVVEVGDDGAAGVYIGALEGVLAAGALAASTGDAGLDPTYELDLTTIDGAEVVTISFDVDGGGVAALIDPSFSIAMDGDRLILGSTDFVTTSLGLPLDESLASDPRYVEAIDATAPVSGGHVYVDITGIREPLEPLLYLTSPDYADVAPFIKPFDRAAFGYGITDDGALATTLLLLLE